MQFQQIKITTKEILLAALIIMMSPSAMAQVSTIEFGKNRVQFRKFKWQYLQTQNFNTYFYEDGKAIANYVLQVAEKELASIEQFVEYGLQRRANIVIYNNFNEMEQSNIGLNLDWQTTGGITKLVNNKMIVYFNGDHSNLRRQIRQGIARTLVENILFGDDLGEFAANQTLLDLPKWLVDGYIEYVAENWSPELDNQLKLALLSGDYKGFYPFAFDKPILAGHSFWYYFANKYKKENVTYFLYLARVYRNVNSASQRICKKKFKEVLKDFMRETTELYELDLRGRRDVPKGTVSIVEEVSKNRDYFRFTPNPAPRSQTYAVVEYVKGKYCVVLYDNMVDRKVILRTGIRSNQNEVNPNYPLLAWDGKGTRIACIYWEKGKTKLFVYDAVARFKRVKVDLTHFEQVTDLKFMLNENTLLLSAVRKGQPDIFVYHIDKDNFEQVTNDSYADLDATFVAFPSKQGIIFSSNRPSAYAKGGDTGVATTRYNIFLADLYSKNEFRQISQLTNMKFGDARYPMQYNTSHFTFVSDETGIGNRFAGFFNTKRAGLDSVYIVGDEFLRNPSGHELDSTLKAWGKTAPDSVFAYSVTNDSAYVFPITNYTSSLLETKIAGDNGLVSEVRQQGNLKFLYRLKVDEPTLRRRNINPRPSDYRKKTITEAQLEEGEEIQFRNNPAVPDSLRKVKDIFDTGFEKDADTTEGGKPINRGSTDNEGVLRKARLFDYKLKFAADNFSAAFNNDILIARAEPFSGSLPVVLQSGGAFNGMLKASIFDLFENIRFSGALRIPLISGSGTGATVGTGGVGAFIPVNQSLFDGGGEWYARVDYLKHRMDYSLLYYRQTNIGLVQGINGTNKFYEGKQYTNLYQALVKYPLDKIRAIRITGGIRTDKIAIRADDFDSSALKIGDVNKQVFALARIEWIHDNVVVKTTNIMNGLRYKLVADFTSQINEPRAGLDLKKGAINLNLGGDLRYYFPIYRNFIWAARAAADFSFGEQKICYYLGGVDGWMFPDFYPTPSPYEGAGASNHYAYQSLAVNMRGFNQNIANGNNALVLNSEFRLPIFTTFFNKPVNNAFVRNFQVVQFIDLGSAWSGSPKNIERPFMQVADQPPPNTNVAVKIKAGGVGPLCGGYGFGIRSTLLGYFLRLDTAWEMNAFFKGKPIWYFAMGVDF